MWGKPVCFVRTCDRHPFHKLSVMNYEVMVCEDHYDETALISNNKSDMIRDIGREFLSDVRDLDSKKEV